ncbi:MAG: hypothetical protein DRI26_02505 [Chloroflexi bacterium]|nr:MAG: hypothetical protein DRI26_02505 [Chloroflexota bacterium]
MKVSEGQVVETGNVLVIIEA